MPPLALCFVAFARTLPSVASVFRFAARRMPVHDPDRVFVVPVATIELEEMTRSPKFLGGSLYGRAVLSDPAGGFRHRPLRDDRCCLPLCRTRRLRIYYLSRLNHAARQLPVYASQGTSQCNTQHSVLTGGQPLPDRIGYLPDPLPKVTSYRFVLCLSSFAKLLGATTRVDPLYTHRLPPLIGWVVIRRVHALLYDAPEGSCREHV